MIQLRNTTAQWGIVAKSLHWLVAVGVLAMIPLGWIWTTMALSPTKLELANLHKSLGIALLALMAIRTGWRLANPVPRAPAGTPRWQRWIAAVTHWLLYAVLLAMPLTGWLINSAANFPLKVFGLFPLPALVEPNDPLKEQAELAHLALSWCLIVLLVVHVAAALYHHFRLRDPVLQRMLPHVAGGTSRG